MSVEMRSPLQAAESLEGGKLRSVVGAKQTRLGVQEGL
jgi:hypothetical protein